jgi:hypothetical protein
MAMPGSESIYDLIPPREVIQPRPPMFRSSIPWDLPATASTFNNPGTTHPSVSNLFGAALEKPVKNRSHAELGLKPGSYRNNPSTFMKNMSKSRSVPSLLEVRRTNPDQLKPSHMKESKFGPGGGGPPKRGELPVMNLVTSKNFIVANAVETILAAPKKPVDNTKDYFRKEDYGKVPKYLTLIKNDINAEYDYICRLKEQQYEQATAHIQPLEEDERTRLLDGLKSKWEGVNCQYQAMTHLTTLDTMGKMRRKEKYEAELGQMERDIERMNKRNMSIDLAR